MIRQQGISSRISKVNEELEKLAHLMADDTKAYFMTKSALQQCNQFSESSDQLSLDLDSDFLHESKGFSLNRQELIHNFDAQDINVEFSDAKQYEIPPTMKESQLQSFSSNKQYRNDHSVIDTTIKKFHETQKKEISQKKTKQSVEKAGKKEKKSKIKNIEKTSKTKNNSKLKQAKSQNKLANFAHSNLTQKSNFLRKTKKRQHIPLINSTTVKNSSKYKGIKGHLNVPNHPLSISMLPQRIQHALKSEHTQKIDSNNSIQHKLHLNLKKEVTLKITDLNIQKQLCQRQSEYLKTAMKFSQQKLKQICSFLEKNTSQDALIKGFTMKTLVKFFAQFFHTFDDCHRGLSESPNQDICMKQLLHILQKEDYLLKYMLRLPTILNRDNTLCQQRCKQLFQEKRFIQRKVTNFKHLQGDIIFIYFNALYDYISFLLNNNMVHETKRKRIPFEFNSERSQKDISKQIAQGIQRRQHLKQYDSQRKKQKNKSGLKRVKTYKVLSPNKSVKNKMKKMHS